MLYMDVSAAVHSRAGLGRYSQQLASALWASQPGRLALFFNQGRDGRFPASLSPDIPIHRVRLGYKPWRLLVLLGHLSHLGFDRLVPDAQIFHSTEHLLMPLRGVPTVLTVHDLIYELFPSYHKRLNYWYLKLAMPLYCQRASAIIAVSQASKRDIVRKYGVEPGKIHVVYEAASSLFVPPGPEGIARVRRTYRLPDRFLIHLGTIEPRKNLERLLDVFQLLRQLHPDLCLVLAGGKGWLYDAFFARIEAEGLGEAVLPLGWVPDEDLPAVIAAAELAVQPSLHEGFGLPILEEMACGQVVAASGSSSHPEVGGDAAAYFDPMNVENMADVIGRLLGDSEERQHRRRLGLEQAGKFSWQRAALETTRVYDQILA